MSDISVDGVCPRTCNVVMSLTLDKPPRNHLRAAIMTSAWIRSGSLQTSDMAAMGVQATTAKTVHLRSTGTESTGLKFRTPALCRIRGGSAVMYLCLRLPVDLDHHPGEIPFDFILGSIRSPHAPRQVEGGPLSFYARGLPLTGKMRTSGVSGRSSRRLL